LRGTLILQEHTQQLPGVDFDDVDVADSSISSPQQLPGVDFDDVDVADSSISSPVRRMIFFAKKCRLTSSGFN
jgi:hypothetical protein